MISPKWYIAIGALSYLVGLAWTAPTQWVVDRLMQPTAGAQPVELRNTAGRIGNGGAELYLAGNRLGKVEWRINPLSLFTGRVGADLSLTNGTGQLNGEASIGLGQRIELRELSGAIPLALLQPHLPAEARLLAPAGELIIELPQLETTTTQPTAVNGTVVWSKAEIGYPEHLPLGELRLEFASDTEGTIKGKLGDNGGPLIARGDLSLKPDGGYRLNLELGARGAEETALKRALAQLGSPNQQGLTTLSFSGSWSAE